MGIKMRETTSMKALNKKAILKKNRPSESGEKPKVKYTMLSFSRESLYKVSVKEIKKLKGKVKMRIRGIIKL